MNYTLSSIFIFATGAAIGSVVTWKMLKSKYEKIAQDEIASVKEVYANRKPALPKDIDEMHSVKEDDDEYGQIISQYSTAQEGKGKERRDIVSVPYVISPEEFADNDDYESNTLTYYADGILTDENDEIVEDVEDMVGHDSLSHFGDYADDPDTVYVRNDELKCDYEILLDRRRFADVLTDRREV